MARQESTTGVALATIVSASAAPYGYTVSLWSSGALLMHFRGAPGTGEVFLFAAGALCGFSLVGLIAHPSLRTSSPMAPGLQPVVAGALHWFAVGIAVGSAGVIAHLDTPVAWLLGSFAATSLYLLGAGLQLAVVRSRSKST